MRSMTNPLPPFFFFSERRLPAYHNHKSATQQHVSLGGEVVALIQGLMVMVATKVTQLNKEHYSLC